MTTAENVALIFRQFGNPLDVLACENHPLAPPAASTLLRVQMQFAPVNASDLIPITGAYRHRVTPPRVAGYEGVGTVIAAPAAWQHLLAKRVLPLRGPGTWQRFVDIDPELAVPVPDDIDSPLAAHAYINPLAALLMLQHWSPAGKDILLTAGGSTCAQLLAQWAHKRGARRVTAIYRAPQHAHTLQRLGIHAVQQDSQDEIRQLAAGTDLVFDAVGGTLGQLIWQTLPAEAHFVAYGVLTGQPVRVNASLPALHWFHVRHYLDALTPQAWQQLFVEIWSLLRVSECGGVTVFPLEQWQNAIAFYYQSGRERKPLLQMQL
ncbi:zinc-dependent alcohol dehydrogenase family protein [Pantoea sp.]|uniref:zinc-dependent alcohol dehydrogenase family protein n=1 Tax=Pantoea sp. TaxID=69393 RepID=UPI0028AF3895|nr:zinc-dependent alcohol dehydrogenase family protein [Pantoea sp.]